MRTVKISLDTNCMISLFSPEEEMYPYMYCIDQMRWMGKVRFYISLKVIAELSDQGGIALDFAMSLPKLPSYPVCNFDDQVGTFDDAAGTWDDAENNEKLRPKIRYNVSRKSDVRDVQIFIDTYQSDINIFLTNDGKFHRSEPSERLMKEFGIEAISPKDFLSRNICA